MRCRVSLGPSVWALLFLVAGCSGSGYYKSCDCFSAYTRQIGVCEDMSDEQQKADCRVTAELTYQNCQAICSPTLHN